MIRQAEIQKLADKDGVRVAQTEKDYILSWILTGISHVEKLRAALGFKGGTALKKFYFDNYRFSEDLDFTLVDDTLDNSTIQELFDAAFRYVKGEANIDLEICEFDEHETGTINFFIQYSGPLGGSGANKKVKVDISKNELLVFALEKKQMIKRYSDHIETTVKCYSLEEIITEKMRSLLSRQQPRDYYDLWYLTEEYGLEMCDYATEFSEKTRFKGLDPRDIEKRVEKLLPVFKSRWEGSLAAQISHLPKYEKVSREMGRHLRKLYQEL